jgi:polynucleotide 5'-hydroxyl-kinase GRC3/NOL9
MMIEAGTTLLVEGEAEVEVKGKAEVFGCPIGRVKVKEGKILPIYILEDSEVEVKGNYIAVKGSTIPESWNRLVDTIESEGFTKIFLFGDTDSGKSSLATYLVNKLSGKKWIVDLDIGQSDIAHPCAMGIGVTEGGIISISDVKMVDGFFVGSITPTGRESRCLRGVACIMNKLRSLASDGDKVIVDTTGWTKGRKAREYKLAKLEIIEPDVIVCFGEVPYYLEDYNTFKVDSFVLKKRSKEVRSNIRSRLYAKWLENSEARTFKADEVEFENTTLFKGEPIDFLEGVLEAKVLFAEKGSDFLNVCVEKEIDVGFELVRALLEVYDVKEVCIFAPEQLKGLLVGLYGKNGRYLGCGLLKEINIEEKSIVVQTAVKEEVERIVFGEVRLNESLREGFTRVP